MGLWISVNVTGLKYDYLDLKPIEVLLHCGFHITRNDASKNNLVMYKPSWCIVILYVQSLYLGC